MRRRVLSINDQLCKECRCLEDIDHLLVSCVFYGNIWYLVYDWLGISSETSSNPLLHFHHFCALGGVSNQWSAVLKMIWLATFYVIWKEINKHIFQQKAESIHSICEQVKSQVLWWFKSKFVSYDFHYNVWRQNPFMCLTVVT